MRALRLTKAQGEKVLQVSRWGKVFVLYHGYEFIADKGLARKATAAELTEYYDGLRADLIETAARLRSAVECQNWPECKRLASHADGLAQEIESRAEDKTRLWALNDAGRVFVEQTQLLAAKREQNTGEN